MKKLIGGGLAVLALGLAAAPVASANYYNEDTVAQFIAEVNSEAERYGTGPVTVYVGDPGDPGGTAIAGTDGNGVITLSTRYAALTPEQFNAAIAEDVAAGWTPGGCNGIQAVAIHEMGHVIDNRNGRMARTTLTIALNYGRVGGNLHGYAFDENGNVKPGEAIAVSFQARECGTATPTEQSIYNLLVGS